LSYGPVMILPARHRRVAIYVAAVASLALAGCSSTSPTSSGSSTSTTAPRATQEYYVSLGDSYAAGYQPTGPHSGHTDTNGFAYQIPALAAAKGYDLNLVNFGCGGATTTSIIHSVGCPLLGPGATPYPTQTQAAAAFEFLRAHHGQIGLITVSIGGNDVVPCADEAQPIQCVVKATKTINTNLATLLHGLRSAAGSGVPIVGTTYPDVILGLYLSKNHTEHSLAGLSVTAFKSLINPALQKQYEAVGGSFVDVTAATGAYGSMTQMTDLPPYGEIPTPVAQVCELTYFCEYSDIHPKTLGYRIIANLVVAALPVRDSSS
jgi:lysophospholipase L1-like esterase